MFLKISKFFLYASVFCVLMVWPWIFFPFIGGKDYFFRSAVQLASVFFLLWWGFEAKAGEAEEKFKKLFKNKLFWSVSAFAAVFMLATFFAFDFYAAFWSNYERGEGGFQMLHYYAFFFLLTLLFEKKEEWRRLFWLSLAVAVAMIFYGVGAAIFVKGPGGAYTNPFSLIGPYLDNNGMPLAPTVFGLLFYTSRFQGSLGNPAYVAPYLMFSLFYLLWLRFSEKKESPRKSSWRRLIDSGCSVLIVLLPFFLDQAFGKTPVTLAILGILVVYGAWLWFSEKKKLSFEKIKSHAVDIGWGLLAGFLLLFFLSSQTRGAFVGLIAAVFAFLTTLAFAKKDLRKWLVPLIILMVISAGLLTVYRKSDFVKKLPAGRLFDVAFSDQTFQTRLWTWNSAWKGFKEKPILGWGPENFSPVFDKYFDPRHYVPGRESETWFDYAHSLVFDYLVETGILGTLSFFAVFLVFYWELAKKKFADKNNAVLLGLLVAMPVGYLVQGLVLFNVLPIYINLFFFLAFACHEMYQADR